MDFSFVQLVAVLVDQKIAFRSCTKATVASVRVIQQDHSGRGMQRYETRFSKLSSPNRENPFGPVHISGLQIQGFAEPQTRDRQQSKQAVVGPGPQRIDGSPSLSSLQ